MIALVRGEANGRNAMVTEQELMAKFEEQAEIKDKLEESERNAEQASVTLQRGRGMSLEELEATEELLTASLATAHLYDIRYRQLGSEIFEMYVALRRQQEVEVAHG